MESTVGQESKWEIFLQQIEQRSLLVHSVNWALGPIPSLASMIYTNSPMIYNLGTGSYHVAQANFKLMILLPQHPKYWNHSYMPLKPNRCAVSDGHGDPAATSALVLVLPKACLVRITR